jgi:hypothetical protein
MAIRQAITTAKPAVRRCPMRIRDKNFMETALVLRAVPPRIRRILAGGRMYETARNFSRNRSRYGVPARNWRACRDMCGTTRTKAVPQRAP